MSSTTARRTRASAALERHKRGGADEGDSPPAVVGVGKTRHAAAAAAAAWAQAQKAPPRRSARATATAKEEGSTAHATRGDAPCSRRHARPTKAVAQRAAPAAAAAKGKKRRHASSAPPGLDAGAEHTAPRTQAEQPAAKRLKKGAAGRVSREAEPAGQEQQKQQKQRREKQQLKAQPRSGKTGGPSGRPSVASPAECSEDGATGTAGKRAPRPASDAPSGAPVPPQQLPSTSGGSFDPSCHEHVTLVKNVLALSGGRGGDDAAPTGRQEQYQQLHASLSACCSDGTGRSIYISGLPGTGKSFTVQRVAQTLAREQQQPPVCVTVNCMALADTRDVYATLLAECSHVLGRKGKAVGSSPAVPLAGGARDAAHEALVALLQARGGSAHGAADPHLGVPRKPKATAKRAPLLLVVLEEVDRLLSRGPEEVYKLFMLPHTPGVHLALVAIANSLDLTERMLPALKCRGASPDFVQSILSSSLGQLPWRVFEDSALELVARTVSGSTGDLRQAFKACRTALEMLVEEERKRAQLAAAAAATTGATNGTAATGPAAAARTAIGLREMMPAVRVLSGAGAASSSTVATIKALPNQQQLVLLAASMVVAGADAAAAATRDAEEAGASAASASYAAARARKAINPFAMAQAAGGGGRGGGAGASLTADAALRVPAKDVYERYCGLCKELFMRPVPVTEFGHSCVLLAEQALLNLAGGGASAGRGGGAVGGRGGGRGRCGGAGGTTQHGSMKLSLKVLAKDVRAALQSNPIYKKVIP